MKYIVFEARTEGKPTEVLPVIFPDVLNHSDVAEMLEHVRVMPEGAFAGWWAFPAPVSAGFAIVRDGKVSAMGSSESLKLNSRPEDAALIAKVLLVGGNA
jgi:hypothetical protein